MGLFGGRKHRCGSWRPGGRPHSPVHLPPGSCHTCWVPCRDRLDDGQERCTGCTDALLLHPSPAVRRLLADAPGVDRDLLRRLAEDPDLGVGLAAQARLGALRHAEVVDLVDLEVEEWV